MPKNIDTWLDLTTDAVAKLQRIHELRHAAESEGRELSRRESGEVARITKEAEALQRRADAIQPPFDPRRAQGFRNGPGAGESADSKVTLAKDERVADWLREHRSDGRGPAYQSELSDDELSQLSLGKIVRGMVTSRWDGAEAEHRALTEGTNSAGGFLTPEPLAARFIDRIRNASRVMQAGATTVPMESDTLNIARMTGGATVAWKTEGNPITPSDMVFDRVTFTTRTLPIMVKLSRELFEDMQPEAAAGIEREIAAALSLELDRGCLRGSGTPPEVKGIRNQSGVTLQSLGGSGATPVWDNILDGVANVRALNMEPTSILWSSRTANQLGKLKLTTGEYIPTPPVLAGLAQLTTNQIPGNLVVGGSTDCSEIYIGDFTQLLVGMRTDLRFNVQVLNQRFADTLEVGLLAYLRADVQLQHAEAFNVITGVRP
jgi:HK97 family phage major capsid protein